MSKKVLTTAEIRQAVERLFNEGGEPGPLLFGIATSLSERIDRIEMATRFISQELRKQGLIKPPGQENGTQVVGERPAQRLGADGTPLDDAQAAAEAAMDAAAGPRPGEAPTPAAGQKPMPPRGGVRMPPPGAAPAPAEGDVRIGADGTPITDPAQLAAEAAMDAAMAAD